MPYTRVTRSTRGRDALSYTFGEKGHNGHEVRNEVVTPVNMLPCSDYAAQMNRYWRRAARKHTTQVLRIVQSFSVNELNPDDPMDILTANEIGQKFVEKHYPGHQALVFTQVDGKGHKIHNHIIVNDVSMVDNKGCDKLQYYQPQLAQWTDEIASRYTTLDPGKKRREKLTQGERGRRENAKWSYKDDLRERITEAMQACTSTEDFMLQLQARGVNAERKSSKKKGEYFTYELTDLSRKPAEEKMPASLKARSYNLGEDYGVEALEDAIKHHKKTVTKPAATSSIGNASGKAMTHDEFWALMYPGRTSPGQNIQEEAVKEDQWEEITDDTKEDDSKPLETDTEENIEEESIVSETVVPEQKDIPEKVQQTETVEEKPEQRIVEKPEPEKEKEPEPKPTKQEILARKAMQEERKRHEREMDFTQMAQRRNRVPNSQRRPDFNRLIQERKEQQGQQYGE